MTKPIVVSKYFTSSKKIISVKIKKEEEEEEEEPILERDLSQHTDTDINEQISAWTVNTQTEEVIEKEEKCVEEVEEEEEKYTQSPNDLDSTTLFSENNDQDQEESMDLIKTITVEPIDDADLDQLNISEGEEEMMNGMKEETDEEEVADEDDDEITQEETTKEEVTEEEEREKENKLPCRSIDINQFRASPIVKKKTFQPLDLNQFKAPTTVGPIDLNQFKAPLDPRYNSRIPPKTPKPRKQVPAFKYMKDTKFVVDAFSYGKIADCEGYFLSHFHTDHYGGLKSTWTHGPIYCSQITANLVKTQLNVDERYIRPLPMDTLVPVTEQISVGLIDANHCPGSVLFLFVINNENDTIRHLHTGDFRASPRICMHPLIRQPENPPLNSVYLDTTYMDPKYAFPAQEECIKAVCDLVQKEIVNTTLSSRSITSFMDKWTSNKRPKTMNERVLIVVGAYKIGKERVFHNVAKLINSKIYVTEDRKQILDCQENMDLTDRLTKNPLEAQVHVVQLNSIKGDSMREYLKNHASAFDRMIAIKPTGWAYKSSHQTESIPMSSTGLAQVIIPPTTRTLPLSPSYSGNNVKVYGVPYSEHSSFRELASFIASLDMEQIIPTVKTPEEMVSLLDQWKKERIAAGEIVEYINEDHW